MTLSVLLRLEGPLQSWGTRSRFGDRDTENEPSKSGVIGLVGAAVGMRRDDGDMLERLAASRMAVRVDREGTRLRDYHTAGGGTFRGKPHSVFDAGGTILTLRAYLCDASFLVALGFEDAALGQLVFEALAAPKWPLSLGRPACPPSLPVQAGVVALEPDAALLAAPYPHHERPAHAVRMVIETRVGEGEPRQDQPLSFRLHDRHFARRFVRTEFVDPADLRLLSKDDPLISLVALRRDHNQPVTPI